MKFLKFARTAEAVEDAAAGIRLTAIVGRSQAETPYPELPKDGGVQRRFWTPGELAAESGSE